MPTVPEFLLHHRRIILAVLATLVFIFTLMLLDDRFTLSRDGIAGKVMGGEIKNKTVVILIVGTEIPGDLTPLGAIYIHPIDAGHASFVRACIQAEDFREDETAYYCSVGVKR